MTAAIIMGGIVTIVAIICGTILTGIWLDNR